MMQQPLNANPVQVVVLTQPGILDKQSVYKNMKTGLARQLIGLGVVHVFIGILCIIFQGVAAGIYVNRVYVTIDFIGHGFWNGLLFIITGAFGISGGNKRNRCQIITFNVLSILSAAFASVLISIAIPATLFYAFPRYYYDLCDGYYSGQTTPSRQDCTTQSDTGIAMEAMMAILGLIEGIIAIWSSVVCCTIGACCCHCGGSCCCPESPQQIQFLTAGQPFSGQQIMMVNQQPQILSSNQQPAFLPLSQQAIIALHPQQQIAQYNPAQPNSTPYSQQSSAYTPLSPAPRDNTGVYTAMRDTLVAPEQSAIRGDRTSAYAEISAYNTSINGRH